MRRMEENVECTYVCVTKQREWGVQYEKKRCRERGREEDKDGVCVNVRACAHLIFVASFHL